MIKEIYKYQFPVFKIEAIITVCTIFVALVLANAIWETTVYYLVDGKDVRRVLVLTCENDVSLFLPLSQLGVLLS